MKHKTAIKSTVLILGVIIIPLLYSYFYLGAFWDPYNTLKTVPVAVVNNDKGAVVNGKSRNLGSEETKALIKDATLKFTSTDESDAKSGAAGTKYYAVITFPENFSSNIATADSTSKQTAEITFSANKKRNYIASQIMKNAVTKLEEETRGKIDKEITSELSGKLKEVPSQLNTLNDGIKKLSDGANTLSTGANKAADGQSTLSNGIKSLDTGLGRLYTGSDTLTSGLQKLNNGVSQASSGSIKLASAVSSNLPSLGKGITQLNSGAQLLLGQFSSSSSAKNPSVYDGVTGLESGANTLLKQFSSSGDAKNPSVYDGVTGLESGANKLLKQFSSSGDAKNPSVYDGVAGIEGNTGTYVTAVNNMLYTMITSDRASSATVLAGYNTNLAQVKAAYMAATDPTIKAQYYQKLQMLANLVTVYSVALDPSVTNESAFEQTLVNMGAADATKQTIVYSGTELCSGTQLLASQFKDGGEFKTGMQQLAGGSSLVASQFKDGGKFKTGVQQLAGGASKVASQFKNGGTFKTGVQSLANGTSQLSSATGSLSTLGNGIGSLTSGISALGNGASQAYAGSQTLTSGLSTAKSGSDALVSGSNKLVAANSKIKDGAKKLSDGANTAKNKVGTSISEANDKVKSLNGLDSYSEKPVTVSEKDINSIPNYGTAFAPYFMSLSLWVGALLMFFGIYLDADERIKVLSRHSNNKFIRVGAFALIGVAQAVALAMIVQFALGLSISNVPAFYFSCILISLVFISIVEFLIVNLKDVGKFLSIALLVLNLTANGGTFPMETVPKFFNIIYPYMPMTYSVNLLKEVTCNFNNAQAFKNVGILIAIFACFTALTVLLSVTRKAKAVIKERLQTES